jgi:6-phosphofructokinase
MEKIVSVLFTSMYHIDNDIDRIEEKTLGEEDAKSYISQVITDLMGYTTFSV